LGETFRDWVQAGVAGGVLAVNETTAKVHVVSGGVLLVSPEPFLFERCESQEAFDTQVKN
jgi:hypothetical protein